MRKQPAKGLGLSKLGAVMALVVALSSVFKIRGADIWWHIRTGQWIWQNRSVPTTDPFSHTSEGPWTYTDALAQLLFYGAHKVGGADGLIWLKAFIVLALGLVLIVLMRGTPAGAAALAVALWGTACHFRFVAKPHLFSYLGFAVLLVVLNGAQSRRRPRWLWLVPALLVLWGNLHRGGTIALVVLAMAVAVWAWRKETRFLARTGVAALALSVVALMLNSAGPDYILSAFDLTRRASFAQHIGEWRSVTPSFLLEHEPWFGILCLVWVIGWLKDRRWQLETLIVGATVVLAISSLRFIPYAAIAMSPGLARGLGKLHEHLRSSRGVRIWLLEALLAVLGISMVSYHYGSSMPSSLWGPGVADWMIPVHAAEFVQRNPPPGRMWNSFNLGGYLLYAVAPDKKVFIDGRNDTVYRPAFFDETARAATNPAILAHQLDNHAIGFAVLECNGPGDVRFRGLHRHPQWQLVYWDDITAVLVRRTRESAAYLRHHGYAEIRVGSTFPRLFRPGADARAKRLASEVLNMAAATPHSVQAQFMAALVHKTAGRQREYLEARARVADLAQERGIDVPLP